CRQAATGQAGSRPRQPPISQNGVWSGLHLGGAAMTGWVVAGAALAAALCVVLYSRWRTARLLARLDEMLTAAMDGSFAEQHFDESRLSALERSEEHTSELQSRFDLVCRLLL